MLDGRTAVLVIIGDPVAQVKAPQPLTTLLQSRGLNAVLVPMHTRAEDVRPLLDLMQRIPNVAGLVVTVPHKTLVATHSANLSPAARIAQAVNVLRRTADGWDGHLLDGTGFASNLEQHGLTLRGATVCMTGAGGAGHAIAFALADAGVAHIAVRDSETARQNVLISRLRSLGHSAGDWVDSGSPMKASLYINATPCGMKDDDPLPFALDGIEASASVADVIMQPHTTRLLLEAEQRGLRIVRGRGMMDRQLEQMADFFAPAIHAITGEAVAASRAS